MGDHQSKTKKIATSLLNQKNGLPKPFSGFEPGNVRAYIFLNTQNFRSNPRFTHSKYFMKKFSQLARRGVAGS
jgi:hypothetical protein